MYGIQKSSFNYNTSRSSRTYSVVAKRMKKYSKQCWKIQELQERGLLDLLSVKSCLEIGSGGGGGGVGVGGMAEFLLLERGGEFLTWTIIIFDDTTRYKVLIFISVTSSLRRWKRRQWKRGG
jgi:hypothetical protein